MGLYDCAQTFPPRRVMMVNNLDWRCLAFLSAARNDICNHKKQ